MRMILQLLSFCGEKGGDDPTKGANQHQQIHIFTQRRNCTPLSEIGCTHNTDICIYVALRPCHIFKISELNSV